MDTSQLHQKQKCKNGEEGDPPGDPSSKSFTSNQMILTKNQQTKYDEIF